MSLPSGGTLTAIGAGTTTIDPISDGGAASPGSLRVAGSGTVVLSDANSYFGSTTVSAGTLRLGNGNALGNSSGVVVNAGASLALATGSGNTATVGLAANGSGASIGLTIDGAGNAGSPAALNNVSGNNTYVGALTLGATNAATINSGSVAAGDQLTLTQGINIPSGGALTVTGPGITTFAAPGPVNGGGTLNMNGTGSLNVLSSGTFSGTANLNGGTTMLQATTPLGTGTIVLNSAQLRVVGPIAQISGFGGNGTGWTVNNNAIASTPITSDVLTLTDGTGNEARSAFFNARVPFAGVAGGLQVGFVANFTYQDVGGTGAEADGATFILQNDPRGRTALGGNGGGLGYGPDNAGVPIVPGAALQMNIYAGHTIGTNFVTNGTDGNYNPTGAVNLASGDPINVTFSYNPNTTTLTETLLDTTTNATFTTQYTNQNLATILGTGTPLIGFTGGDGGVASTQTISNFNYQIGTGNTTYTNNIVLTAGTTSAIDVGASAQFSTITMGNLTVNGPAPTTLNVTGTASTTNSPYSLVLGTTSLNSNATFNVANNGTGLGTLRLSGAITDTGVGSGQSINKTGAGALALTSPTGNSYLGGTTVNGGSLRVANASGSATGGGSVAVGGTSTLGLATGFGVGAISGNVTVASGGGMSSASVGSQTIASLTLGNGLALGSGTTSSFTLNGIGVNNTTTANALIYVSGGTFSVAGANAVSISGAPAVGTYNLYGFNTGSGAGLTVGPGGFNTPAAPAGSAWHLALNGNQLDLVVTQVPLTWNGAAGGGGTATWDTTSQNWAQGNPGIAATYSNGLAVFFSDTDPVTGNLVANTNVVVQAGGVTPLSVVFNNSGAANGGVDYSFSNSGTDTVGISGGTSVTINGGGSVTFTSPNTYTGGTVVSNGTLVTSGGGTVGTAGLEVDGNGTNVSVVSVQNTLTIPSLTGMVSGSGTATVSVGAGNSLTISPTGAGTTTFAGSVSLAAGATAASGGSLTKAGSGTQVLTGVPQLGNNSVVNVTGGSLKINVATGTASVGTGVTANVSGTATLEIAGPVSTLGTTTAGNRATINNTSTASAGLLVSSGTQQVGPITGTGTTQVNAGSSLTANSIIQGALVIGGTASSAGTVTIAASDASGNSLSIGVASLGSSDPSDTGTTSSTGLSNGAAFFRRFRRFDSERAGAFHRRPGRFRSAGLSLELHASTPHGEIIRPFRAYIS